MQLITLKILSLHRIGRRVVFFIFAYFVLSLPPPCDSGGRSTKSKAASLPKIRCVPNGPCFCPEDPLTERYPDPADDTCEHFYLCHLGRAFKKKCDVRTAFHPEKSECLPRQRVPESVCKLRKKIRIYTPTTHFRSL
jgi:hypothetical protein